MNIKASTKESVIPYALIPYPPTISYPPTIPYPPTISSIPYPPTIPYSITSCIDYLNPLKLQSTPQVPAELFIGQTIDLNLTAQTRFEP
ncbi:hypothetical protein A2U01_0007944 [Trifolium medium]|uniref:Uncharacterized protein n=1 Tax=Trifolium medium TaxID=97028 RepID=A0A392MJ48_9FABA|nr:hypothetical protein [Trifolium medium]